MKLKIFASAVIALATLAMTTSPARAVLTLADGDLFIGFRATSGSGTSTDYLVKLGQYTQFTTATSAFTVNIGNILTDLNATYSSDNSTTNNDWYGSSTLLWSVFGTNDANSPNSTLYVSRNNSTPWGKLLSGPLSSTDSNIDNASTSYLSSTQSTNDSVAAFQPSNYSGGYSSNVSSHYGSNPWNSSLEGTTSTALYLNSVTTSAGTSGLVGTFSLSDTGVLTFSPSAVPEPSTYALLGLAATTILIFRRRRAAIAA